MSALRNGSLPPCAFRSDYCYFRGRIRSQRPQGHTEGPPTLWIASPSAQLLQLRLRLLQPDSHLNLPHQCRCSSEMRLRLRQIAGLPIELSQTNVAVSDERAHGELFSEGESLAIVVFRLPDIKRIFARRDLAKEPKSVSLVSSLFVPTGETQSALCGGTGIRFPPGQEIRFAQPDGPQRFGLLGAGQSGTLDGLLQEGNSLSDASKERIGVAQGRTHCMKERRVVHSLTDLQGVPECECCLVKIPPPEIQKSHPSIRHGNAIRMADRLRYVDRLCASGDGFDELSALSQC